MKLTSSRLQRQQPTNRPENFADLRDEFPSTDPQKDKFFWMEMKEYLELGIGISSWSVGS